MATASSDMERMMKPLIEARKCVYTDTFYRDDFMENSDINDMGVQEFLDQIPGSMHDRVREDSFSCMKQGETLMEDCVEAGVNEFYETHNDERYTWNAGCVEEMKTVLSTFCDLLIDQYLEGYGKEFRAEIEDQSSTRYIDDPVVREAVATYTENFVAYAFAAIPYEIAESDCEFDAIRVFVYV